MSVAEVTGNGTDRSVPVQDSTFSIEYTCKVEPLRADAPDWGRAFELLNSHYDEIKSTRKRPHFNPNIERYLQLQNENRLVLSTARTQEGLLMGYCIFFIYQHPHYRHIMCAMDDIHYVVPEIRHSGIWQRMMEAAMAELKLRNVGMVSIRVPIGNEYTEEMKSMGFDEMEKVYYKSTTQQW